MTHTTDVILTSIIWKVLNDRIGLESLNYDYLLENIPRFFGPNSGTNPELTLTISSGQSVLTYVSTTGHTTFSCVYVPRDSREVKFSSISVLKPLRFERTMSEVGVLDNSRLGYYYQADQNKYYLQECEPEEKTQFLQDLEIKRILDYVDIELVDGKDYYVITYSNDKSWNGFAFYGSVSVSNAIGEWLSYPEVWEHVMTLLDFYDEPYRTSAISDFTEARELWTNS